MSKLLPPTAAPVPGAVVVLGDTDAAGLDGLEVTVERMVGPLVRVRRMVGKGHYTDLLVRPTCIKEKE